MGQPVTLTGIRLDQDVIGDPSSWGGAWSNVFTSPGIDSDSDWTWRSFDHTQGSGSQGQTTHGFTGVPDTRFVYVSMRNWWGGEDRVNDIFYWNNIELKISAPCSLDFENWFTVFC